MFFGWFNAVFSIVFPLIFFGLMCLFIFTLISNLRTWNKNNHSPRLSIPAAVVQSELIFRIPTLQMLEICLVHMDIEPAPTLPIM